MPKLLNKSARIVVIPYKDKDKRLLRVQFPPLKLVTVSTEDWKIIKEIYLIKRMLDNGELIEGAAAGREAIDEDSLQEELKKDLTSEEIEKLEKAS